MESRFLKSLIDALETFEREQGVPAQDLAAFGDWLASRRDSDHSDSVPGLGPYESVESAIGKHVVHLSRYAAAYSKPVLGAHDIGTLDEFAYLGTLLTRDRMPKSELIAEHLQEKTSGTDVIRRLVERGWVRELDDPEDRRRRPVAITPEGRARILAVFEDMDAVAHQVAGNLTDSEKRTLHTLLRKLETHHATRNGAKK